MDKNIESKLAMFGELECLMEIINLVGTIVTVVFVRMLQGPHPIIF